MKPNKPGVTNARGQPTRPTPTGGSTNKPHDGKHLPR